MTFWTGERTKVPWWQKNYAIFSFRECVYVLVYVCLHMCECSWIKGLDHLFSFHEFGTILCKFPQTCMMPVVCASEKGLLKIVLWAIDEELSAFVVILSEMILEEEKKDDVRGNWVHISFIPVSVQMSQLWFGEIFLSCWVTLENDILWCIIVDFTLLRSD